MFYRAGYGQFSIAPSRTASCRVHCVRARLGTLLGHYRTGVRATGGTPRSPARRLASCVLPSSPPPTPSTLQHVVVVCLAVAVNLLRHGDDRGSAAFQQRRYGLASLGRGVAVAVDIGGSGSTYL